MSEGQLTSEEKKTQKRRPEPREQAKQHAGGDLRQAPLVSLQQQVGNRAVQRLLAQRSGNEPTELDEDTAARINRERGGGQPLDAAVQAQAGEAMGHDLSDVRVHSSPEADSLSRSLRAKAFTTGQDVFFRAGAYEPHSSSGQELIHHELTHVVQQSLGSVGGGGGRMTVNPPGDSFEQEADAVAGSLAAMPAPQVQRQETPEEEEVQAQAGEEEEEEEEAVQMQSEEEGEEEEAMP